MPRHPPCALHSLSQQRQDNTHTPPTITGRAWQKLAKTQKLHSPQPTHPQQNTLGNQISREGCSRPLCRSQTTTPPTPTPPHPKNTRAHTRAQAKGGPEQPHHTTPRRNTSRVTTPRHTADSSGPNSVLILPNPCLPKHKACETRRPDVSTIPLVNTTIRARTFAWRRGMCSLERR